MTTYDVTIHGFEASDPYRPINFRVYSGPHRDTAAKIRDNLLALGLDVSLTTRS